MHIQRYARYVFKCNQMIFFWFRLHCLKIFLTASHPNVSNYKGFFLQVLYRYYTLRLKCLILPYEILLLD